VVVSPTLQNSELSGLDKTSMIVCLDGPAGSGKSTISRLVARKAGFIHLDTGAYYRSLALLAKQRHVDDDDEAGLAALAGELSLSFEPFESGQRILLNGVDVSSDIRTPEISVGSSIVSRHPRVREQLVEAQRAFATNADVIVEGRDTGTVVFPNAELKIYLDASIEVRAKRRLDDFAAQGETQNLQQVIADLAARDKQDSERAISPLKQATDAILVDTSDMTPEQVIETILKMIEVSRAN
jgi:cytidylate kinase